MPDPLSDPLSEVVAEFGEDEPPQARPAPPLTPPMPVTKSVANLPAATTSPESSTAAARQAAAAATAAAAEIGEIRDGLAGMRTDLRQVPEQVGQVISGTMLHAVSVALTEVRRPLESMSVVTEQLSAVLGRLEGLSGLREQVSGLHGLPDSVRDSAELVSREMGALTSDIAALVTRVTGMDGRIAETSSSFDAARASLTELESRLAHLDDSLLEVARLTVTGSDQLLAAIRDQVATTVRDQLRDLVRDGVRDGIDAQLGPKVEEGISAALEPALVSALDATLGAAVSAALDAAIGETLAQEQAQMERRLVMHIDDAVMELAEVLMRHQVATLKTVTVIPEVAQPQRRRDEDHTELDRLLTRITPPASLSEAVANAVARAGIGSQFAKALITPPPQAPTIPVPSGASDQPRPQVKIPRAVPEGDEVDELLSQWRDPELRQAALTQATQAATVAVEAAEVELASEGEAKVEGHKRRGLFGRNKG